MGVHDNKCAYTLSQQHTPGRRTLPSSRAAAHNSEHSLVLTPDSAPPRPICPPLTDIADARGILSTQRFAILEAVPEKDRAAAAEILDALSSRLEAVTAAAAAQDADRTAARMASALEQLGKLEILQAPGLPFLIPAAYADRPRLVGRATAEFVIARANGASFGAMSDGLGPQKTAKVEITLDGYNAPLTAGNAAALINRARNMRKAPSCFVLASFPFSACHTAAAA